MIRDDLENAGVTLLNTRKKCRITDMASQMQQNWHPFNFISLVHSDEGMKITCIGMAVNAALALGKGFGGWLFNSQTLNADGLHSLADLLEDFLSLFAVFWSAKSRSSPSSLDFNLARLGAASIGGMLLAGGLTRSFHCLSVLVHLFYPVDDVGSFQQNTGSKHTQELSDLNAVWFAVASIIVKEWLYRLSKYNFMLCAPR